MVNNSHSGTVQLAGGASKQSSSFIQPHRHQSSICHPIAGSPFCSSFLSLSRFRYLLLVRFCFLSTIPFFRPLRFRHACHHGGDSLPRHKDRHCCSSSPPLRRRSLWAYRQGDPEACRGCSPRREFGPDSSGIKQFCRCVVFTHTYSSRPPVADEFHKIQQSHSRKMKRIRLFGS